MKVMQIDVTPVRVPLQHPVNTAGGTVGEAPLVLIDLHTDADIVGRAYIFTYSSLILRAAAETVLSVAKLVEGQTCDPTALKSLLETRFRLLGYSGLIGMAISGIDMAAWDAHAKVRRQPLVVAMGGREREVQAYCSQGMDGVETGMRRAETALRQGFRAVKIRTGYPTLEEDVAVVAAVKSVLGQECGLMVDYNQSLGISEAMRRCAALDDFGLVWIEEPTLQDDYEGHAAITAAVRTPIQMGENWFGTSEMKRCLAANGSDYVMPDLMKIGGITGWIAAASLAETHGKPISSHLFQEFSVHALACSATAHYLEWLDIAGPILRTPLTLVDGRVDLAGGPDGVGLEWDRKRVDEYRL